VKVETLTLPPPPTFPEMVVAIPVVMVWPSEVKVVKIVDTFPEACSPSVLLPAVAYG
jgi:hypothetical protein